MPHKESSDKLVKWAHSNSAHCHVRQSRSLLNSMHHLIVGQFP